MIQMDQPCGQGAQRTRGAQAAQTLGTEEIQDPNVAVVRAETVNMNIVSCFHQRLFARTEEAGKTNFQLV